MSIRVRNPYWKSARRQALEARRDAIVAWLQGLDAEWVTRDDVVAAFPDLAPHLPVGDDGVIHDMAVEIGAEVSHG